MKIFDCHSHAGGKNYHKLSVGNESHVNDYYDSMKKDGIEIESTIFFGQPYPYPTLQKYYNCMYPLIDYFRINNIVANECREYNILNNSKSALFAPIIDERDYNAYKCLKKCDEFNLNAIKAHSGGLLGMPYMLEDNGIIDYAKEKDIPLIIHENDYFFPELKEVIKRNPKTDFIIAHLAFLHKNAEIIADNAYFDTAAINHPNFAKSIKLNYIDRQLNSKFEGAIKQRYNSDLKCKYLEINLERIIKNACRVFGSGHILFGSDFAWSDAKSQIDLINSCEINEKDKENIFHKNFEKIFKYE